MRHALPEARALFGKKLPWIRQVVRIAESSMKRTLLLFLGILVCCAAFLDVSQYANAYISKLLDEAGDGGFVTIIKYTVLLLTGNLAFPLQIALGGLLCVFAMVEKPRLRAKLSYLIHLDLLIVLVLPALMTALLWLSVHYVNTANAEWLLAKENLSFGLRGVSGGEEFIAKTTKAVFARMVYWFVIPPVIIFLAWKLLKRSLKSFLAGLFLRDQTHPIHFFVTDEDKSSAVLQDQGAWSRQSLEIRISRDELRKMIEKEFE